MTDELETIVDHTGETRALGRLEPDADSLLMRAGMMTYRDFLESRGQALVPSSQWQPVDNRNLLGKEFILNQGQFGACVGFSAANAVMRSRFLSGQAFIKLSGAFVYAHVNNDQDRGAIITDAMGVLQSVGTCLEVEFNIPNIYLRQIGGDAIATAKRFRLRKAYTLTTFAEMADALQRGFIPQFPIMVGKNFQHFSGDGIAGYDKGPGNHSVHADCLLQLPSGEWVFRVPNTWGPDWGPFGDGTVFVTQKHIDGCAAADDAYAHEDVMIDPTAPIAA